MREAPIIRALCLLGKTASRQLSALQMIAEAIATDTLALTGIVGTVAGFQVSRLVAFHVYTSLSVGIIDLVNHREP
jgi:hypothetical protein